MTDSSNTSVFNYLLLGLTILVVLYYLYLSNIVLSEYRDCLDDFSKINPVNYKECIQIKELLSELAGNLGKGFLAVMAYVTGVKVIPAIIRAFK